MNWRTMWRMSYVLIALGVVAVFTLSGLVLFGNIGFRNSATLIDETKTTDFHPSMFYFNNSDFFSASLKPFADVKSLDPQPRIFIVNQHVLAAHLIAKQFMLAADPKVKTVVLITQNNWNAGQAPVITSRYGWKTPLGIIESATKLADNLIEKNLAAVDENIFNNEHGINGIVPYVARVFPNARVVPLVIRDKTSDDVVDALAAELSKLDLSETVIVGTIDMSHYMPKYVADAHDRLAVQAIKNFEYETLLKLDIDTAPTLRTILKVAELVGEKNFVQTGGINSADIVSDPELMITTSYVTGYFTDDQNAHAQKTEIETESETEYATHVLFVGDIMFDRGVALHAKKYGEDSLFGNMERLFLGTHAVVGNLEGTITDFESISEKNPSVLQFTFAPTFAKLLERHNFKTVSLANNHTFDFGREGFEITKNYLTDSGLTFFGSPRNEQAVGPLSTVLDISGIESDQKICLVGYHDLFSPDPTPAIQEIERIRNDCAHVVLFAHWGSEYSSTPNDHQKKLAHQFVDAGADLVIGAHPHVVQPLEIYKNRAIFYSLGNFIFDQNISFATEHGLAVHVEWSKEKTRFTLVPTSLDRGEVSLAAPADRQKVLSVLMPAGIPSDILTTKEFTLWNQ